jgi:hypothetical protein
MGVSMSGLSTWEILLKNMWQATALHALLGSHIDLTSKNEFKMITLEVNL